MAAWFAVVHRRSVACALGIGLVALAASAQGPAIPAQEVPGIVLDHIQTQSAKHGVFWVNDAVAGESIGLEYVEMVDGLHGYVDGETFFAGARFLDPASDHPVFVDVVMRGDDPEALTLVEVVVRERDGEARHHWVQGDGLWERRDGPPPAGA